MGKREIKVSIQAQVAEYEAAMMRAAKRTREMGSEADRAAQKARAFEQIGRSWAVTGGIMAAGIGAAIKRFADFDQAMSNVAATGQDARNNIDALRQAAIEAGARTVFSAEESANALEEMAKAGIDAKDVLGGGLAGALDLAAAGGLGVADAAGIAAVALKTFKLEGSDMGHVADLLAAGAGKAMGDVQDLSLALRQGGQAASLTGLSIEETTAALSAFASQGLLGSDAGTSLKTMLLNLNPTTKKARELVDELNIAAFDQQGNFIGLAEYAGKLQAALGGMSAEQQSAALKTIFGTDAYRAAAVVLDEGEAGIRRWISAVDDQGYAANTARERLDNLKGDVEALGGAVDSAFITMGAAANGPLRSFVQALTAIVDGFNELPDPAKDALFWVGATGSAALTAGGLYLSAVPKIAEYKANLKSLGITASRTTQIVATSAAGLGVAIVGASVVVGALAAAQAEATARAEAYADTLEEGTNRITDATRKMARENLAARDSLLWWENMSAYDAAEKLGISLDVVTDAALRDTAAMKELQTQIEAAADQHRGSKDEYEKYEAWVLTLTEAVTGQAGSLENAIEMSRQMDAAHESASANAMTVADAYREEVGAVDELEKELTGLLDTMNDANDANSGAISSNAKWRASLAGIKDEVEEQKEAFKDANGTLDGFKLSLDQNTVAGSANAAMLAEVADSARKAAADQYEVDLATMSAEDAASRYIDTLTAQRAEFIKAAEDAGFSAKAVQELVDVFFVLPDEKSIEILANPDKAMSTLEKFIRDSSAKTIRIGVVTYKKDGQHGTVFRVDGDDVEGFAGGGAIRGPGGPTEDKIPIWASSAENDPGVVVPIPPRKIEGARA